MKLLCDETPNNEICNLIFYAHYIHFIKKQKIKITKRKKNII